MINNINQQSASQTNTGWLQKIGEIWKKILKTILFIKDPYTLKELCKIAEQIQELEENQSAEKIGTQISGLESDAFQEILWDDFIKRQEICLEIYNDLEHIISSLQKMKNDEAAQKAAIKIKAIYLEILRWYMVNNLEGVQSIPNYDRLIDKYGDIKDEILEIIKE